MVRRSVHVRTACVTDNTTLHLLCSQICTHSLDLFFGIFELLDDEPVDAPVFLIDLFQHRHHGLSSAARQFQVSSCSQCSRSYFELPRVCSVGTALRSTVLPPVNLEVRNSRAGSIPIRVNAYSRAMYSCGRPASARITAAVTPVLSFPAATRSASLHGVVENTGHTHRRNERGTACPDG